MRIRFGVRVGVSMQKGEYMATECSARRADLRAPVDFGVTPAVYG